MTAEYRTWLRTAQRRFECSLGAKHIGGPVSVTIYIGTSVGGRGGRGVLGLAIEFLCAQGAIDGEHAITRICLCGSPQRRQGEFLIEVRAL